MTRTSSGQQPRAAPQAPSSWKNSIKELGLFLLGLGVFLFALLALHFYITKIIVTTPPLSAFCREQNGMLYIHITNLTDQPLKNIKIEVGDERCLIDLPPRSSDICIAKGGRTTIFRVEIGDTFKMAGDCYPAVGLSIR